MKNLPQSVTCEDIEGKQYTVPTNKLTFRPAVYGVIVKDDKILLSKCWDGYDFPGGGIELGEKTEDALVREVKEETGMEVEVDSLIFSSDSFFKLPYKDTYVHSIHLYFSCTVVGGDLSTKFFDEQEKKYADMPEWIPLKDLPEKKFYTSVDHMEVIEAFQKRITRKNK